MSFIIGVGILVAVLPLLVNSVAFLAGAEDSATFHPVSYGQECNKGDCHPITHGYLSGSGEPVTWHQYEPLAIPFTVRVPVWGRGFGRDPITGTSQGIGLLLAAMAGCPLAFFLIRSSVKNVRGFRDRLFDYRET